MHFKRLTSSHDVHAGMVNTVFNTIHKELSFSSLFYKTIEVRELYLNSVFGIEHVYDTHNITSFTYIQTS